MSILERVQADTTQAMRAGERERVGALRMLASSLQQAAKEGSGDEVAILQRERKKRLEAAAAYREAGRSDQAASEQSEAEVIEAYLPEQLDDEELRDLVGAAVEEAGAEAPRDMGKVMSLLMPRVQGRAEGGRVSEAVRQRLGS